MTAANLPYIIEQGATWQRFFTWKARDINSVYQPVDLRGYTAKLQFRITAASTTVIKELTHLVGISLTGLAGASFTGSCAGGTLAAGPIIGGQPSNIVTGAVLTASGVTGTLALDQVLYRASGAPFATITGYLTGTGGDGTYSISYMGTIAAESMTSSHGSVCCSMTAVETAALTFAGAPIKTVIEGTVIAKGPTVVYDLELYSGANVYRVRAGDACLSLEVTR